MIIAISKNGERIRVEEKGQRAFCPECDSEVIGKFGSLNIPHWAHKPNSICKYGIGETNWHLAWKEICKNDYIEIKIGNKRADIVSLNKQAIEFQHSYINTDYIMEKNDNYIKNGYKFKWIFDYSKYWGKFNPSLYYHVRWKGRKPQTLYCYEQFKGLHDFYINNSFYYYFNSNEIRQAVDIDWNNYNHEVIKWESIYIPNIMKEIYNGILRPPYDTFTITQLWNAIHCLMYGKNNKIDLTADLCSNSPEKIKEILFNQENSGSDEW